MVGMNTRHLISGIIQKPNSNVVPQLVRPFKNQISLVNYVKLTTAVIVQTISFGHRPNHWSLTTHIN